MLNSLKNMVSNVFYAPATVAQQGSANGDRTNVNAQRNAFGANAQYNSQSTQNTQKIPFFSSIKATQATQNINSVQGISSPSIDSGIGYNPFVQQTSNSSYGVNRPVKGGYFAGYYNGKPNIVGRRLFIEA